LRKGIAVAVETKNPFSAELVENGAASSIRWKGEPPPPQIGVACSRTNRLKQLDGIKENGKLASHAFTQQRARQGKRDKYR
jgi:hypothetical protein